MTTKNLPIYQIDAFSDVLFAGNPAAVVPLSTWLPDDVLQKIAMENNLSETAFFVQGEQIFTFAGSLRQLKFRCAGMRPLRAPM